MLLDILILSFILDLYLSEETLIGILSSKAIDLNTYKYQ